MHGPRHLWSQRSTWVSQRPLKSEEHLSGYSGGLPGCCWNQAKAEIPTLKPLVREQVSLAGDPREAERDGGGHSTGWDKEPANTFMGDDQGPD